MCLLVLNDNDDDEDENENDKKKLRIVYATVDRAGQAKICQTGVVRLR